MKVTWQLTDADVATPPVCRVILLLEAILGNEIIHDHEEFLERAKRVRYVFIIALFGCRWVTNVSLCFVPNAHYTTTNYF